MIIKIPNIPKRISDLTLPKRINGLTLPKTNIVATASAIALSACANTGTPPAPFDDAEIAQMRQVANNDINNAIAHKLQQENLLSEVQAAAGGVHNRQLPPTHKVDAHLDIQALSPESMQSIVNDGQDSRHTTPVLPSTHNVDYAKSTAAPVYTPPIGTVTAPVQQIDGDVYKPQSITYTPATRTAVDLNWQRGGNALKVPAPTHLSTHVKSIAVQQTAPNSFGSVETTNTRTPVALGGGKAKAIGQASASQSAINTPKAAIQVNNNMRPLMQELPTPINGRVKVSEALNMVAKASGYSFNIQGDDKDYIVDFKNFSGTLLDLLKVVGDGLGEKGTVSVETKTKSIKLKYD